MVAIAIAVITLILLMIEMQLLSTMTILFIMAFGSSRALSFIPGIHLVCSSTMILGLSLFTGWAARRLSRATPISTAMWGAIFTLIDIVILPFILIALAIILGEIFQMLI